VALFSTRVNAVELKPKVATNSAVQLYVKGGIATRNIKESLIEKETPVDVTIYDDDFTQIVNYAEVKDLNKVSSMEIGAGVLINDSIDLSAFVTFSNSGKYGNVYGAEAKYIFKADKYRPFIGAGLTLTSIELSKKDISNDSYQYQSTPYDVEEKNSTEINIDEAIFSPTLIAGVDVELSDNTTLEFFVRHTLLKAEIKYKTQQIIDYKLVGSGEGATEKYNLIDFKTEYSETNFGLVFKYKI
jgi:opacity protein-like surface antigen